MFAAQVQSGERGLQRKWSGMFIEQAAKLIGTNDKQIRRAIYAHELPAVRLGKSYSIAVADLTRWFERKKKFL